MFITEGKKKDTGWTTFLEVPIVSTSQTLKHFALLDQSSSFLGLSFGHSDEPHLLVGLTPFNCYGNLTPLNFPLRPVRLVA